MGNQIPASTSDAMVILSAEPLRHMLGTGAAAYLVLGHLRESVTN